MSKIRFKFLMTPPAIEDLQPIADKLAEATQKIYEAVELAAQLKLKPRHLSSICGVVERIESTQMELLEAAKRTPSPVIPRLNGFEISSEEMERMRQGFLEQMELNRNPSVGLGLRRGFHPIYGSIYGKMLDSESDHPIQDSH